MHDLTLDETLNIMLIIFGLLLLIIPLFYNGLQNQVEIKDRKGKLLRIELVGFNTKGKIFIVICILSLGAGVWKAIRDEQSKNRFDSRTTELQENANILQDSINALNHKVDTFRSNWIAQYKNDTLVFGKILKSLHKNNLGLTKEFNVFSLNVIRKESIVSVTGSQFFSVKDNSDNRKINQVIINPKNKR